MDNKFKYNKKIKGHSRQDQRVKEMMEQSLNQKNKMKDRNQDRLKIKVKQKDNNNQKEHKKGLQKIANKREKFIMR